MGAGPGAGERRPWGLGSGLHPFLAGLSVLDSSDPSWVKIRCPMTEGCRQRSPVLPSPTLPAAPGDPGGAGPRGPPQAPGEVKASSALPLLLGPAGSPWVAGSHSPTKA